MQVIDIPTEQTTAATDALLALAALGCAAQLWRWHKQATWKAKVWAGMFGAVALAGGLGALAHGLQLEPTTRSLLWHPLNAALGLSVALFGAGAIYDWWGPRAAKSALPAAVAMGSIFFVIGLLRPGSFLLFVVFETAAMLLSLYVYASCVFRHRLPGALWMTVGVLLTIIAAAIQASHGLRLEAVWEFDHNGLFHLVQIAGVICLVVGLGRDLVRVNQATNCASLWRR